MADSDEANHLSPAAAAGHGAPAPTRRRGGDPGSGDPRAGRAARHRPSLGLPLGTGPQRRIDPGRRVGRDVRAAHARAWEPAGQWWPDGLPELAAEDSQRELARRWLTRFGPATADDLQWWTGWTQATVRRTLRELPVFGIPQHHVFDNRGNIGPTLWWDGEIIGSWTVTSAGKVRTASLADRGSAARSAVQDAAARLEARLQGTAVTPAIRTPLERQLANGTAGYPLPVMRSNSALTIL